MAHSGGHDLIAFLHGLSPEAVPRRVADRAGACLSDALACGLFGASRPWSRIVADDARAEAPAGRATVIAGGRLAAPAAALCNATAIHGFELDDLIAESIVHPGAAVVPAALAAGEEVDAPGGRLLCAIVAGYEVTHRLGLALGTAPARAGFHTTSLAAPAGAAVAAAIATGLDRDRTISAAGLACSAAGGIKAFAAGHGGGMVKRLHLGRAAEAGVRMARLAARGFDGPPHAFDGRFGMCEVFGGDGANPVRLTEALGERWALDDVWFKVWPICGWIHAAVQLVEDMRGPVPLASYDIRHVRVGVSSYAARNNGEPAPVDTMGAQYSIPYCVAAALAGDARDPASFEPEKVRDPARRALARLVEVAVDPEMEALYPAKFAARVRLELADGTVREGCVTDCRGTPADPCGEAEQTAKLKRLAGARLTEPQIETLAARAHGLAGLSSVRLIGDALAQRHEPGSSKQAMAS